MDHKPLMCKSVDEFFQTLSWSNTIWGDVTYGDLGFRGQSQDWPLLPSAFRKQQLGYLDSIVDSPLPRAVDQAIAEYRAVFEFLRSADAIGLPIRTESKLFKSIAELSNTESESFWETEWPPDEVLEALAIAQHHGVPTRLLDFTYSPDVAGFFAALGATFALSKDESQPKTPGSDPLVVWIVDLRFIRRARTWNSGSVERIKELIVPRAGNAYLHAQDAFFLLDSKASQDWSNGNPKHLDMVLAERAKYWAERRGFWHNGSPPEFVVAKVTAPRALAPDILREYHRRGLGLARLMPSYDGVVRDLQLRRCLNGLHLSQSPLD